MSEALSSRARAHLQNVILPFWKSLRDDARGGYTGYVDFDLTVDRDAPKGCILNSRLLWTFSNASMALHDASLLSYAKHAYDFLARFWDEEQGGLYWMLDCAGEPLDTMKHTYCQAFGIYGLCAYAKASGNQEALDKAMALYRVIEARCKDEMGYLEAFRHDFSPADNRALSDAKALIDTGSVAARTMNATLHVMEAYTQLYLMTKDAGVGENLRALVDVMTKTIYNQENRRQEVFFDKAWRSLADMQSFGHDIEASWLLCETANAILDKAGQKNCEKIALSLASSVYERAYGGAWLDNECDRGEIDHKRVWWVQAEAVVGFFNAFQLSGDKKFREAAETVFDHIESKLVDHRPHSEWHWCLHEDETPFRQPIVEPWKCPYHNGRMCMELMARNA